MRQSIMRPYPSRRVSERGGIVILVALMLLTLLSVAAFSLGRTVIREIGISGNVFQAGRADAVADAGLDWFISWESAFQAGHATPTTSPKAKAMTDAMNTTYKQGLSLDTNLSALTWSADVAGKDGMVLNGLNTDNTATQAFNLQLLCLGKESIGSDNPSGGTNPQGNGGSLYTWEVLSTGQAIIPGDAWRFQSIRAGQVVIRP